MKNNVPRATSAAHITITDDMLRRPADQAQAVSKLKADALFDELRHVGYGFGDKPDKNKLAVALITVCIRRGCNTRPQIIGALKRCDLHHGHVAITLKFKQGDDPARHLWREEASVYQLHDPV